MEFEKRKNTHLSVEGSVFHKSDTHIHSHTYVHAHTYIHAIHTPLTTLTGDPICSKKASLYQQLGEVYELCVVTTNITG